MKSLAPQQLRNVRDRVIFSGIVAEQKQIIRETIHVPLHQSASEVIEGIRDDTGVSKTEAATRIFEWFAGLDRKLRLAVLNRDADTRRELTRLVLAEMAGVEAADPGAAAAAADMSIEQAVRIARVMLDHVERLDAGRKNEPAAAKRRGR